MRATLEAEVAARGHYDRAQAERERHCQAIVRIFESGRAPAEEHVSALLAAFRVEADARQAWLAARERERAS